MSEKGLEEHSLFVYITHFYDSKHSERTKKQKIIQLAELILGLSRIDVKYLEVDIFTNRSDLWTLEPLFKPLDSRVQESHWNLNLVKREELVRDGTYNPWLLTWSHKKKLEQDVLKSNECSLFLYLEDDAIFLPDNLEYFLRNRSKLQNLGLVPGFVRAEFSTIHGVWTNPDNFPGLLHRDSKYIGDDGIEFRIRQYENPFSASILLDLELANEYLMSKSFSVMEAGRLHPVIWDTGATAALGLISESVPVGFSSRVAVMLNPKNSLPLVGALLRHQGDRYAKDVWQSHYLLFDSSETPTKLRTKRSVLDILKRVRQIRLLKRLIKLKSEK